MDGWGFPVGSPLGLASSPGRSCGETIRSHVAFHVNVRLFFPALMCNAAMLQTMDSADGDGKPRQSFRYVFGLVSRPYRIIVIL
jgi:hypothetical protein